MSSAAHPTDAHPTEVQGATQVFRVFPRTCAHMAAGVGLKLSSACTNGILYIFACDHHLPNPSYTSNVYACTCKCCYGTQFYDCLTV